MKDTRIQIACGLAYLLIFGYFLSFVVEGIPYATHSEDVGFLLSTAAIAGLWLTFGLLEFLGRQIQNILGSFLSFLSSMLSLGMILAAGGEPVNIELALSTLLFFAAGLLALESLARSRSRLLFSTTLSLDSTLLIFFAWAASVNGRNMFVGLSQAGIEGVVYTFAILGLALFGYGAIGAVRSAKASYRPIL